MVVGPTRRSSEPMEARYTSGASRAAPSASCPARCGESRTTCRSRTWISPISPTGPMPTACFEDSLGSERADCRSYRWFSRFFPGTPGCIFGPGLGGRAGAGARPYGRYGCRDGVEVTRQGCGVRAVKVDGTGVTSHGVALRVRWDCGCRRTWLDATDHGFGEDVSHCGSRGAG